MVKVSESVQDREYEQAKLVDRLDQKVTRAGEVFIVCASVVHRLFGPLQAPNPTLLLEMERVNLVSFLLGKCTVRSTDKMAGQDAGKSERCVVTAQIRAYARHESGLTSSGSLIARHLVEPLLTGESK